jgi:hypothetical protein
MEIVAVAVVRGAFLSSPFRDVSRLGRSSEFNCISLTQNIILKSVLCRNHFFQSLSLLYHFLPCLPISLFRSLVRARLNASNFHH